MKSSGSAGCLIKLGCTFSMFATDKLENLDEVKNFYLSLPVRYEYMISDIVANIEKSDVSSASVQRAYYFIYKTKKEMMRYIRR